ncbi:unnamed protein product [Lota lota]
MSRDLYNPYSPESQDSPQHPYQPPNAQVGPGNVGEPSHLVPGSTRASFGVYSGTSMNPSHSYPSMHPGSMGYIPVHSTPATELESAIDVHIKRAREEAGLQSILKKPAPDQNTLITAWPEGSLGLGPAGYRSSTPISEGQFSRYSKTMPSDASSWHWLSGYQTGDYRDYHSTSSSSLSASNIPPSHYSLSSDPYPVSRYSKPTTAADSAPSPRSSVDYEHPSTSRVADNQTRYTCESAMDILKRFDLQEEDLEELCAYSEDQLSPANLPYLLRDIRQKKTRTSSAASQSSMVHQAQGSQRAPETNAGPGAEVKREEAPPTFQQSSKVIEYGHTSKYTVGFREEDQDRGHHSSSVRPSGFSESGLMNSYISRMRNTQPKDAAPAKHGVPVFSNVSQRSNISSPVYSPSPSVMASLSQMPAAQSIQTAISSPKKEPVALQSAAPVAKPAATNIIPKRDSSADRVASSGCQRPAQGAETTSHRPAPGAVTNSQRPAPGSGTTSHRPAPGTRTTSHGPASGVGTTSHRPAPGVGTTGQRPVPGAGNTSHKPAPCIGTTSSKPAPGAGTPSQRPAPGAGTPSQRPAPGAGTPSQIPAPGAGTTSHRPAPGTDPGVVPSPKFIPMNQVPPPASDASIHRSSPAKPAGKSMPTAAMISDYMGVTPELFPHTCCLCNKPCVGLKVSTSVGFFLSCLLGARFPYTSRWIGLGTNQHFLLVVTKL